VRRYGWRGGAVEEHRLLAVHVTGVVADSRARSPAARRSSLRLARQAADDGVEAFLDVSVGVAQQEHATEPAQVLEVIDGRVSLSGGWG
jgi:hypothetical protein